MLIACVLAGALAAGLGVLSIFFANEYYEYQKKYHDLLEDYICELRSLEADIEEIKPEIKLLSEEFKKSEYDVISVSKAINNYLYEDIGKDKSLEIALRGLSDEIYRYLLNHRSLLQIDVDEEFCSWRYDITLHIPKNYDRIMRADGFMRCIEIEHELINKHGEDTKEDISEDSVSES